MKYEVTATDEHIHIVEINDSGQAGAPGPIPIAAFMRLLWVAKGGVPDDPDKKLVIEKDEHGWSRKYV